MIRNHHDLIPTRSGRKRIMLFHHEFQYKKPRFQYSLYQECGFLSLISQCHLRAKKVGIPTLKASLHPLSPLLPFSLPLPPFSPPSLPAFTSASAWLFLYTRSDCERASRR
eukprot:3130068-Rhodomonas_salina.2